MQAALQNAMKRFITLFALTVALYAQPAHAAILAKWEFDGSTPSPTGSIVPISPTDHGSGSLDANMQTAILDMADPADGRTGGNCYKSIDWEGDGDVADFAEAISNGQYFSIQFEAQAGYQMSLTSLDLLLYQTSFMAGTGVNGGSAGGADFAIYSSIGGFTAGNEIYSYSLASGAYSVFNVDLTGGSFDNLTNVEFRIYAKGATGNSNGFYIGKLNTSDGLDDIVLNGSISTVPEPSTYALIALGAIALMSGAAYRRRMTTMAT